MEEWGKKMNKKRALPAALLFFMYFKSFLF